MTIDDLRAWVAEVNASAGPITELGAGVDAHLDYETQSAADLTKIGGINYARDPSTDICCLGWTIGSAKPRLWVPGMPVPPELLDHAFAGGKFLAWNAPFERWITKEVATKRYGFPTIADEDWECVMARAAYQALPLKLEQAAPAVGLEVSKDMEGHRIMKILCKPNPKTGRLWRPIDTPERFKKLYAYCLQDVVVEREIAHRVLKLSKWETELYWMDQRMNDRGIYVDDELCEAADFVIGLAASRYTDEIRRITNGQVAGPNAVKQIVEWLANYGIETDGLDRETLEDLLERDDIPGKPQGDEPATGPYRVLEIRKEAAKTSTSKIKTLMARRSPLDGRMTQNIQVYGAGTHRDAARGAQLQNLPSRGLIDDIPGAIEMMLDLKEWHDHREISSKEALAELEGFGPPLSVVSSCIRGMVTAGPGKVLYAGDLSQIEARMVCALAGQEDKIEAFRLYDTIVGHDAKGKPIHGGPDAYVVAAAGVYGIPIEQVDAKKHRPTGKICVLGLGFGGGAMALLKMARQNRVSLEHIAEAVYASSTDKNIERSEWLWDRMGCKSGVKRVRWMTADLIKNAWRDDNQKVVKFWADLELAAKSAVQQPGKWFEVNGLIKYRMNGSFLQCRLPSGNSIWYPEAKIVDGELTAMTLNIAKKWVRRKLYGGLLCENVVQSAARDVIKEGTRRAELLGYLPVLPVHDEDVAERDMGTGSVEEFLACLAQSPRWLPGLPVAADGWTGVRYRK